MAIKRNYFAVKQQRDRILAYKEGPKVTLLSRNDKDRTQSFAGIAAAIAALPARNPSYFSSDTQPGRSKGLLTSVASIGRTRNGIRLAGHWCEGPVSSCEFPDSMPPTSLRMPPSGCA